MKPKRSRDLRDLIRIFSRLSKMDAILVLLYARWLGFLNQNVRTRQLLFPAILYQSVTGAIALSLPPERGLVVWSIGNFVLVGLVLLPVSFKPKQKVGEYSDFINDLRTPKR